MGCAQERLGRRGFLGLLGVGLAAAMTGCNASTGGSPLAGSVTAQPSAAEAVQPPPALPSAPPGTLSAGPAAAVAARQIALSVDDGYCNECVAGYVDFAHRTGTHLTFSPNGLYSHAWAPQAAVLRPLIDAGQVQIINHSFNHPNLTTLPLAKVREELERNEEWIAKTFATSTRPYYRPPFGRHNPAVDQTAAALGLDQVVLWNGSLADSNLITPQFLMDQARRYLQPGVIMLGHANHPTVLGLFDQLTTLIHDRALTPVTLDEMFGTRRPPPH